MLLQLGAMDQNEYNARYAQYQHDDVIANQQQIIQQQQQILQQQQQAADQAQADEQAREQKEQAEQAQKDADANLQALKDLRKQQDELVKEGVITISQEEVILSKALQD